MRRALASLLVFVMTFALVARGVAAPLMHLHPDVPTPISVTHTAHDHGDCGEAALSDVAESDGVAHSHADHAKHKSMKADHGKVCDSNGACCGSLVLSDTSDGLFGLATMPEPARIVAGAGIKPLNPDRPPSPSIA